MEGHKCKLCSRTFANGRALGGHMKAHLATFPLPPKPEPVIDSPSFSSSSDEEQEEVAEAVGIYNKESDEKVLNYGLRENPKKSFRLSDPEFSFAVDAGSVVQDRESETESKNPTRRRSKRTSKFSTVEVTQTRSQESELNKKAKPSFTESPAEPEPASSVSDTSPEEDVAMCLMMLSRDRWKRYTVEEDHEDEEEEKEGLRSVEESKGPEEKKLNRVRGKNQCEKCRKTFRSSRALGSHRNICFQDEAEARNAAGNDKIFECPYCNKVFGSGQALGGHKRSHLLATTSSSNVNVSAKLIQSLIDLNLPAPGEEDELSVVSDA